MNTSTAELNVTCPGCGASVKLTSRPLDKDGRKTELVIPGHNPLPGNANNADPKHSCLGSGQYPAKATTDKPPF